MTNKAKITVPAGVTGVRAAALMVVLFLFALLVLLMPVVTSSMSALRAVARHSARKAQGLAAARAGIEHALWELQANPAFESASGVLGDWAYEVSVQTPPDRPGERKLAGRAFRAEESDPRVFYESRALVGLGQPIRILGWLERGPE